MLEGTIIDPAIRKQLTRQYREWNNARSKLKGELKCNRCKNYFPRDLITKVYTGMVDGGTPIAMSAWPSAILEWQGEDMKKPLKPIGLCEICGREKATQCHERFPDTKTNFRLYGDLLYTRENTMFACAHCHASHAKHGQGLVVWDEMEFCAALCIEPRSKTARAKAMFR